MSDMTIEIVGLKELDAKFDRLKVLQIVGPPMVRSLARLQTSIKVYPARKYRIAQLAEAGTPYMTKRKPRGYKRTGLLKKSWTAYVENDGQSLIGIVSTPVPYAGYVQGGKESQPSQAWMHKGIWRTTDDVVEKHKGSITRDFNAAIKAALEG